jgi:hypothetical protein
MSLPTTKQLYQMVGNMPHCLAAAAGFQQAAMCMLQRVCMCVCVH